ncbi:MAG: hypothetical protein HY365_00385 [Candidatus Aenigmarchaeota archaeon]|nr:hypothetical protein [Candidatus Aenigmarchaeota archaeon]
MDDLRAINAHLDGLEAKLRNTFVDIDTRMARLESVKEGGSEERMQELEDLMLLLQVENAKLKEAGGANTSFIATGSNADDTDDNRLEQRMSAIESDISNLRKSAPAFNVGGVEERLNEIEKRIESLSEPKEKTLFKKELSSIKSSDLRGVESRLDALEKRLGETDGKSIVPAELYDKIAALEEKIESTGSAAPSTALEKRLQNVEQRLRQPDAMSKGDVKAYIDKLLAVKEEVQQDMEKLSSMKNELQQFTATRGEIEKKLGSVEVSAERANAFYAKASNIEETLDRKLGELNNFTKDLESKVSGNLNEMERARKGVDVKIDAMEEKIQARLVRLDAVKESLDNKFREIQSRMGELKELESKVAQLAALKPEHDPASDKTARAVRELQERFEEESAMRASVDKAMQEIKKKLGDVDRAKRDIENQRATAVDMAKGSWNYAANLEKRIAELEHELVKMGNMEMELGNETASRLATEKDVEDAKKKISSLEKGMMRLFRAQAAKAPGDITKTTEEPGKVSLLQNDVKELRARLEEESALRASMAKSVLHGAHNYDYSSSINALKKEAAAPVKNTAVSTPEMQQELDRHITDFNNQMNAVRSRILQEGEQFSQFVKDSDIVKLRHEMQEHHKTLKSIDKKIEKSATKFFAENLEEFAKALDRNMPAFVTRDRYEQDIKRIDSTLKNISAPDIAPLYDRMDMLERDVGQLVLSLRTMLMRVPIVVE